MPHDHSEHERPERLGHNRDAAAPMHLHSHLSPTDEAAELQALTAQFIEGFVQAGDKAAYLKLAGVPLEIASQSGGAPLKLVDLTVASAWRIGAASPAFGSKELSYLPYPGDLIKERVNCSLIYVSLTERRDVDIRDFLKDARGEPRRL